MTATLDLNACCSISYGHFAARWLLGQSFHPGGLRLTSGLAHLMGIQSSSEVLDAGSGRGASAVHLAQTVGCRVTGVTLEAEGVTAGYELAKGRGLEDCVDFVRGDIQQVELQDESFDFVLMECVLSILDRKGPTLSRLRGMLKPGGRVGLSDVTVAGRLPPELDGVLAAVGCIGGALSLGDHRALLEEQGFSVEHTEEREDALSTFLRDIGRKLLMAKVARKLGMLAIGESALAEGERILALAREQMYNNVLGYGLVVARKTG